MKMPIAEVADRYTILLIKKEHGLNVDEDLEQYKSALRGVHTLSLYIINKAMWVLEDAISVECNMASIGATYLELRKLTLERTTAKNKIAAEHGGPIERKNY